MSIPLDYGTLRLIWWLLLGVLLIGFAVMDGFDLGVAMLLPFVARTDAERRVIINTIGPHLGRQSGVAHSRRRRGVRGLAAALRASFSGFYIAMFLVLLTLILRPVGFEFRNKFADARWRAFWDYALFAGGLVPSVVFGVAFGNLLQGVPFRIDPRSAYFLRRQRIVGTAQSVRPAVRPGLRRDAGDPRRHLSDASNRWPRAGARSPVRHNRGDRDRGAVCRGGGLGLARHRRLRDHQRHRADGPSNPLLKTVVREPAIGSPTMRRIPG